MTKSSRLPERLQTPPLIESVFEIRFVPSKPSVAELMPGFLFGQLGERYPDVQPLPLANIPQEVRQQQENLRYQATHQLTGESERLFSGDRVVGCGRFQPYPGWPGFREAIHQLVAAVRETKLVKKVERFSMKAVNLLESPTGRRALDSLNLELRIAGSEPPEPGLNLRAEYRDENFRRILQIVPAARIHSGPHAGHEGLIVDIDCIRLADQMDFWERFESDLEDLHLRLKTSFFRLLKDETIARLGPEYQDDSR